MPDIVVGPRQTFSPNFHNHLEGYYYFSLVGKEIRTQGVQGHIKVNGIT